LLNVSINLFPFFYNTLCFIFWKSIGIT